MIVFFLPHQLVETQLREQKLLQRMLNDRGESDKGIQADAEKLVQSEDRKLVQTAILSLANLHVCLPSLYKKLKKNGICHS